MPSGAVPLPSSHCVPASTPPAQSRSFPSSQHVSAVSLEIPPTQYTSPASLDAQTRREQRPVDHAQTLEKMSATLKHRIETLSVGALKPLHPCNQIRFWGLEGKVIVVRH